MKKWVSWLMILVLLAAAQCVSAAGAEEEFTDADSKAAWVVQNYTSSDMTDEQKALALHDWLVLNAYYDMTLKTANRTNESGVLLDGTGVCDSYSKAYVLLLSKAGIESKRVSGLAVKADGTTESHSWNLVKLGGKWYQVDVTWDDPVDSAKPTEKVSGLEHRLYFKASRRFMDEEHRPDEASAALINELVGEDTAETLPAGVDHSKRIDLPDLHLISAGGGDITGDSISGKHMILVYGRISCVNTRAFLSDISPYIELLGRRGVQVTAALFDNPSADEMKEFANTYPGVVVTKVASDDYSMWAGLNAFGNTGNSVIFPVIFLKNKNNKLTYYSTNYVERSLAVVSGALDMAGDPDDEPAEIYTAEWVANSDGTWSYRLTNGTWAKGIQVIEGTPYGFSDQGIMVTGWAQVTGKWVYAQDSGALARGGWALIDDVWYCFNDRGEMMTGWVDDHGTWYYLQPSGVISTGWQKIDGAWYYFGSSGAMASGWIKSGGSWYYLSSSGAMATGWKKIGGSWYFFRDSGTMTTGWYEEKDEKNHSTWYWFDDDGVMATGWKEIKCQWEMFADSGVWLYTWDGN